MFSCAVHTAQRVATRQDPFRTENYYFPCGHQPGLASHIEAELPQTDQRLLLASIVIDMSCGFVLVLKMCRSLCKIAGFVCVHTATAQMTIGEGFIASGHTHYRVTESAVFRGCSGVVFVCGCVFIWTY